jgi:hypothetical protein
MRTLIDVPAAPIRSALAEAGWRVDSIDAPDVWWCRERWHLRSTRSPGSRQAFLTFLVDPEHKLEAPKIWAVKASPRLPLRWQADADEHALPFRSGWRKEIAGMLGYLNGLRS